MNFLESRRHCEVTRQPAETQYFQQTSPLMKPNELSSIKKQCEAIQN